MRSGILFTANLLVGLLPLTSQAQADRPFYVGAGVNLLTNVPFYTGSSSHLVGPSFTAGWQFTPHLAVQVSPTYQWQNESYTAPIYQYGSTGTVGGGTSYGYYKYFTVPVLLRYTFTPPTGRFNLDALAGVTIRYSAYTYGYTPPYPGQPFGYESKGGASKANITLGPAVRYALSSSIELTANGLVSAILGSSNSDRFSDRLFLNALVGAQYSFSSR
jgi:hypothetical protein